jgi:hypothetical protein
MAKKQDTNIDIIEINTGKVEFCLVGITPFICESMSYKAMTELLLPKGRKTAAEKATTLKHDPLQEFRNSVYANKDDSTPTYIEHLSTAIKKCIASAAIDVPGASKAQLGRLMWVNSERVPLYGEPRIFMTIVRSADMNRTPDVRTRAIIPEWACRVSISFVQPILNVSAIANLLAASGLINGLGGWRPQKGSGNYGQFRVCDENDPDFLRITKIGRESQIEAMQSPVAYDEETEKLLDWYESEVNRRGMKVVQGGKA